MSGLFESLLADLNRQAKWDHIGLWVVVRALRTRGGFNPDELKIVALNFVRLMLSAGFVAGLSRGNTFEPWTKHDPNEVVERIDKEWTALGHAPNIGDIVWFYSPRLLKETFPAS